MVEHGAEIAHVEIAAALRTSEKVFGLAQGRTRDLADDLSSADRFVDGHYLGHDGHLGELCAVTGLRNGAAPGLLGTGFGYLNFLGRSCREPFGGDQNASI